MFVKQDDPIVRLIDNLMKYLRDNMIVNVGEAHIVVNLLKEQGDEYDTYNSGPSEQTRLKLKIFGGPSSGEIL